MLASLMPFDVRKLQPLQMDEVQGIRQDLRAQ